MASQILPLSNGAAARACIFAWQGVSVQFPARSRSGVRTYDGVVVFAMPAAAVRVDDWGVSCVLWTPARRSLTRRDEETDLETLKHCRLAVRLGMAEGFVLYDDPAQPAREGMLALRVVKAGREYWARWGHVARSASRKSRASDSKARI